MKRLLSRLVRWVCDPAKIEVLEGDLEELFALRAESHGRHAVSGRYLRDVCSLCLRHSRFATRRVRRRFLPIAAAALLGGILVLYRDGPPNFTVDAHDPAGRFTLEIHDGRVLAATLEGDAVSADRLVQRGDVLVIRGGDGDRDFALRILPRGIEWQAREPR